MVIGIIAEGVGDIAVLENILWLTTEEDDEIRVLRPEDVADETDLQRGIYREMIAEEFGSWTLVKADCVDGEKFKLFLEENPLQEERKIIIHLDTAECDLEGYDVVRPEKVKGEESTYCQQLRQAVIDQINTWLNDQYRDELLYAICIEETEAWLLPLYENRDSSTRPDPKARLERLLTKVKATDKKFDKRYKSAQKQGTRALQAFLSSPYRKASNLQQALPYNQSLADFVESLEE